MVTTRSKSKKAERKKIVWDALRIADRIMELIEHENFKIDMPEASLIMTALPLNQEYRKLLIDNAEFTA